MMSKARRFLPPIVVLCVLLTAACVGSQDLSFRDRMEARAEARRADVAVQQSAGMAASGDVQTVTLMHDGIERSFLVHVPAGGLPPSPSAVLVFHGGRGAPERIMEMTGMNAAADQGGFLAVYPASAGLRWNNGKDSNADGADDVGFTRAVIARLQQDYGVDPARVFATGMSSGGGFLYKLACDAPGLIAAIAPVSSNMSQAVYDDCAPGRGIPVAMFSGTSDPLMPFNGGASDSEAMIRRANGSTDVMTSSYATAAFWARQDGCGDPTSTDLPDSSDDDTTVTRLDYACGAQQVHLFQINGGGHAWPGSAGRERRMTGQTSQDINATATIVQFFRNYGL